MKPLFFVVLGSALLLSCATPPSPAIIPTAQLSATDLVMVTATPGLSETATETPIPFSSVCSPLVGHSFLALKGYISQGFTPPQGTTDWDGGHHGLDIAYYQRNDEGGVGGHINGTPIQSVFDGNVAGLGFAETYGNYLIIETPQSRLPADLVQLFSIESGESIYLLYAHMQELAPFVLAEPIDCGQQIGNVGNTGDEFFVVEPHLHFETRIGISGIRLDAMNFYDTLATEPEKTEYRRWRNSADFRLMDPMLLLNYEIELEESDG